jgi:hypothetical protein
VDSEEQDVSPKNNSPEIQRDPVAAWPSWGGERQIQEVDRNRQQPKKNTNDKMFAPNGLHKPSVYQNNEIQRFALLRLAQRVRPSPVVRQYSILGSVDLSNVATRAGGVRRVEAAVAFNRARGAGPCGAPVRRLDIWKVDIFRRSIEAQLVAGNERKFGNTAPAISRRLREKIAFLERTQPRNSFASLFGNSRRAAAQQILLDFAGSGLG